ncbi:RHS repeat-associated core domain-containing protein [Micromonospora sp. PTRAS2]
MYISGQGGASTQALTKVGGLPIALRAVEAAATRTLARTPQPVRVQVYDRTVSNSLGATGPLIRLAPFKVGIGKADVSIDYGGLAGLYGGDWAARLRLVRLPDCALTSPSLPQCRTRVPISSVNDTDAGTVTARLEAPDAGMLLALTAGDSSTQGDYGSTKLAPSASWDVNLSSGGFSWSYPLRLPPVPGGLVPETAIAYSSQSVDGRTTSTNNQGSWIGEGFSYEPGYIERRYKPCKDDGHSNVGDVCWARDNATIVLNGEQSGELVKVDDGTWKLTQDDGSKIQRLTGATNGDADGEHWKLTTADGTEYYFGLNRLPGWTGASGQEETRSTWSLPVFGDDATEPCHKSSGFADSYCDQAWRWNLDYVKDPRGNVVSYFYERETNHYARGGKTDTDGTAYHRAGYLKRVDYGERDGAVYTTEAPARVVFDVAERCLPTETFACRPEDLTKSTASSWPDVPYDLNCASSTHCTIDQASPSFWTRKRLTTITTQIRSGGTWAPVERWSLTHDFTNNGDASRTLWLSKVKQTGLRGIETAMPPVEFVGIQMPNRIDVADDMISELNRYRLKTIYTETGGQVDVNYAPVDCFAGSLPKPGESQKRCFPVRWSPLEQDKDITDWFHKYVVAETIVTDRTGGNPDMVTRYAYDGEAGWRKAKPDGITKSADLTWSDWRGYRKVTVSTGDGQSMPTKAEHFFFRGLDGGPLPDGGTRESSLTDSTGVSYPDQDEWAGQGLETITWAGAEIVTKTISEPWLHYTHTQTEDWGTRRSYFVRTAKARNLIALEPDPQGNARWRKTETISTYDSTWGRLTQVNDRGDTAPGMEGDDRCARTWYIDNPAKHMYTYVLRSESVSVDCSTTPDRTKHLVADTRTSYDSQPYGTPPNKGVPTTVEQAKSVDTNGVVSYLTTSETTVDGYGRTLTDKNALGHTTTTSYVDTAGLNTQTTTVDAMTFETTATIDPAFGLPTTTVDPNNKRTERRYDALGRLTEVWLPNRTTAQTPNVRYTYTVRTDMTLVVKTEKIKNDGTYRPSYELYDSLTRPRQTQTQGPDNGWLITDTFHTGTGQTAKVNSAYHVLGQPGEQPIVVPEGSTNGQTSYLYDGAGRVTAEITSVAGDEKWRTTTRYGGDRVHVDPPTGGEVVTEVSDARGNRTELHQYHGDSPSGAADVTRFGYTPSGLLSKITDVAGNVWEYTYDLRGRKISAKDPDAGTTTYTFDDLGQVTTSTDGRNVTLRNVYDKIGRKTQTWQVLPAGDVKLSEWSYDGLAKGQLHWTARYVNGKAYGISYTDLDQLYRPGTTTYSIPSDAGAELARSYQFTTVYNLDDSVQSIGLPQAGGLPAEAVVTSYDDLLRPTALTGASSYVTSTSYARTGELMAMELFAGAGKKTWQTWNHERGTSRLANHTVKRQDVTPTDRDATYSYDPAGNILSIADTPAGGLRDIQCFSYDHLRRLDEAWTTDSTAVDPCSTGPNNGGPAPYHQSWTFDEVGNRQTETIHDVNGGGAVTRAYSYNEAGTFQPHAVKGVQESGPAGTKHFNYRYDEAGNTICRPDTTASNGCEPNTASETLAWDPEGHLASVTAAGQTTSFVYDSNGNRLVRKESAATTVYLPGLELRLDHTTRQVSGTRFYSFNGASVAVRGLNGIHFQITDHHGTAVASVAAATGAITWRRSTPYGGPRGNNPTSWPSQRGFLGGPQDPMSGLTHLGAREYDPLIGRFISVDPIQDLTDPQQWNPFAYANNSPVTLSDPTGLWPKLGQIAKNLKKILRDDYWRRHSQDHTRRHNAARDWAAAVIRVQVALMGGDPTKVQTELRVKGGSKEKGSNNDGNIDIIYVDDKAGIVYVWEVKKGTLGTEDAVKDINKYRPYVEKAYTGYKVRAGFALAIPPAGVVVPSPHPNEALRVYNGTRSGAVLYDVMEGYNKPVSPPVTEPIPIRHPVPAPLPGPQPQPYGAPDTGARPTTGPAPTPYPTPWGPDMPYGSPLKGCSGTAECVTSYGYVLIPVAAAVAVPAAVYGVVVAGPAAAGWTAGVTVGGAVSFAAS